MSRGITRRRKKTSPIFGELANKEKDPWWQGLFYDLSDGIFPHRVNYADSTLFFKAKTGKYVKLTLDSDLPVERLVQSVKTFFLETVKLLPSTCFDADLEEELGILTFKDLQKNDLIRRIAIFNYLKNQDLTDDEFSFLQKELWWGFVEKRWTEDTFVLEENMISDFDPDIVSGKTSKKKKKSRVE